MQCYLLICRMLIRSRLDYGAIVYSSASQTTFRKLDLMQSEVLTIVTGAFKSSPTDSLESWLMRCHLAKKRGADGEIFLQV